MTKLRQFITSDLLNVHTNRKGAVKTLKVKELHGKNFHFLQNVDNSY